MDYDGKKNVHLFELMKRNTLELIRPLLTKSDVVIVGPGLSLDSSMQFLAQEVILMALQLPRVVIVDGDAIRLLPSVVRDENIVGYFEKYSKEDIKICDYMIPTPNVREAEALYSIMFGDGVSAYLALLSHSGVFNCVLLLFKHTSGARVVFSESDMASIRSNDGVYLEKIIRRISEIRARLNTGFVFKFREDQIFWKDKVYTVNTKSSLKRCGGQGDLFCGITAALLAKVLGGYRTGSFSCTKDDIYAATLMCASHVMRTSAKKTFDKKGIGMVANDIISYVPDAVNETFGQCWGL